MLWGGRGLVLVLTSVELFGSNAMALIILWRQLVLLYPEAGAQPRVLHPDVT